jgi:predicted DNA binding protein
MKEYRVNFKREVIQIVSALVEAESEENALIELKDGNYRNEEVVSEEVIDVLDEAIEGTDFSNNKQRNNKMKTLILIAFFLLMGENALANDINSNNTIIIKPVISEGCCRSKCKTKVVIKKEFVEKKIIVEKPIEKKVFVDRVVVEKVLVKKPYKKNRLSLVAGVGPTRLDQPNTSQVDLLRGPVAGVQYQRSLSESFSLGVQVQTNQTLLGVIGFDF